MTAYLSSVTENWHSDAIASIRHYSSGNRGCNPVPDPSRDVSDRALETEPRTVAVDLRRSNGASNATAKRRSAAIFPKSRPRRSLLFPDAGEKLTLSRDAARAMRHTSARGAHARRNRREARARAYGTEKRALAPSERARLERRRYAPRDPRSALRPPSALCRPFPRAARRTRGGRARSARRPASPSSRALSPLRRAARVSARSLAEVTPRASAEARARGPFSRARTFLTTSK